jgi:hypothetical protein
MKKLFALLALLALLPGLVFGQVATTFAPGQTLTAAQLNNAFAQAVALSGSVMSGPLTVPTLTVTGTATLPAGSVSASAISPTGSTAGQAIVSTGPTTAPAWGGIGVSGIAAIAANSVVANATSASASPTAFAMPSCSTSSSSLQWTSGTGFTCYGNSASLTGATFTGGVKLQYSGATFLLNDTSGSAQYGFGYQNNGTALWALWASDSSSAWYLQRFVSGSAVDNPISVANATGVVTLADGLVSSSVNNAITSGAINNATIGATTASTGAFTTLSASSTVSGTGFSTYLASPPSIGGTTAAAGSFTTLNASGLITPTSSIGIKGTVAADSAQAGSIGEYFNSNVTNTTVTLTTATAANVTSLALTAGDWDVSGMVNFNPAGTTVVTSTQAGISATSATQVAYQYSVNNATHPTGTADQQVTPVVRINVSSATTVYLVATGVFTTSTLQAGGTIRARRVR